MIDSADISVLLQGPYCEGITPQVIDSVRQFLPNAQIILSTWKNKKISPELVGKIDRLIQTPDPGPGYISTSGHVNNINRQILSTKVGLDSCTRKYLLKSRSDLEMVSTSFLGQYDIHKKTADLFRQKLLVLDFYTRNPRVLPIPFHLSDWVLFGLAQDVKEFYEAIPFQTKEDDEWFIHHTKDKGACFRDLVQRLVPEQHFLIKYLESKGCEIDCKCYYAATTENTRETEKIFAKNFIVSDYSDSFYFLKYNPNRGLDKGTLLNYADWSRLNRFFEKGEIWPYLLYLVSSALRRFFEYQGRKFIVNSLSALGVKNKVKEVLYRLTDRKG